MIARLDSLLLRWLSSWNCSVTHDVIASQICHLPSINPPLTKVFLMRVEVKLPPCLSHVPNQLETKVCRQPHVFRVKSFNGAVRNSAIWDGSHNSNMAALKTRVHYLSLRRKTSTEFQRRGPCFHDGTMCDLRMNRKSKIAACNREYASMTKRMGHLSL